MAAALTIGSCFMPSAYADGKAMLGCSSPYQLATIVQIDAFSQPLVTEGYFTQDSLLALLNSLDHNGNGSLCYKVPPGWGGPPATNAANRSGFVNLVDDKVL
ncbi:MAG: hypothetical protein ABI662_00465 [Dermatophilaceae bacterium]